MLYILNIYLTHFFKTYLYLLPSSAVSIQLGWRDEEARGLRGSSVRSYLVGNAGSRPISEAKQPWACPVLGWGTTGEAHVLYSSLYLFFVELSSEASAWEGLCLVASH